jgi:hypothetical protein
VSGDRQGPESLNGGSRSEAGVTLIEVMFTLALTLVTFTLVWPSMKAVTSGESVIQAQANAEITVGGVLVPLTSEISSAAVVYSPNPSTGTNYATQGTTSPAGDGLLLLTQTGPTTFRCDQWVLISSGELETRSWVPGSSSLTPFLPVSPAVYPPPATPFALIVGTPPSIQLSLALRPIANRVSLTINTTLSSTDVGSASMAGQCESGPAI